MSGIIRSSRIKVVGFLEGQAQALLAAVGGLHLEPGGPQSQLEQADRIDLVLNDQDLGGIGHGHGMEYRRLWPAKLGGLGACGRILFPPHPLASSPRTTLGCAKKRGGGG